MEESAELHLLCILLSFAAHCVLVINQVFNICELPLLVVQIEKDLSRHVFVVGVLYDLAPDSETYLISLRHLLPSLICKDIQANSYLFRPHHPPERVEDVDQGLLELSEDALPLPHFVTACYCHYDDLLQV